MMLIIEIKAQGTKSVGTCVSNDRIIIMSIKYSEYLDAVAIKYRTLSYNDLAPKAVTGALPRINLSFAQVIELLGPYCGVRVLDQLKAVVPLAAI